MLLEYACGCNVSVALRRMFYTSILNTNMDYIQLLGKLHTWCQNLKHGYLGLLLSSQERSVAVER